MRVLISLAIAQNELLTSCMWKAEENGDSAF